MKVTVIGTGLIGGSMALALKEKDLATRIIGVEANSSHANDALELQLVDEIMSLEEAIAVSELIILAIPVNGVERLLPTVLDKVRHQVVMDVGSIKGGILDGKCFHNVKVDGSKAC